MFQWQVGFSCTCFSLRTRDVFDSCTLSVNALFQSDSPIATREPNVHEHDPFDFELSHKKMVLC